MLKKLAGEGDCVIVGRCADVVLWEWDKADGICRLSQETDEDYLDTTE